MRYNLHSSLTAIAAGVLLACSATVQAEDKKADPSGTWTLEHPRTRRRRSQEKHAQAQSRRRKGHRQIVQPGRQGNATEVDIENGKIKGDEVSFSVTRQFGDNKRTMKYAGKISGDSIKGKVESERDGETQSRDWEAKREAEKK